MSTITQTTVVFSCPKCGLNYQVTQEHSSDQSSGSFDCKNCKTNVLKWSGVYDYSRWTPVPQASDGKARGGRRAPPSTHKTLKSESRPLGGKQALPGREIVSKTGGWASPPGRWRRSILSDGGA